jgi:hypothetical protein
MIPFYAVKWELSGGLKKKKKEIQYVFLWI